MRYFIAIIVAFLAFSCATPGCEQKGKSENSAIHPPIGNKMKITIGAAVFTATLNDNPTASAFKAMLPLAIAMRELNSNEKYFYLSETLPHDATNPGNIQEGDLMLYGDNCLVLFYKTFTTSYSYTKLGRIDNTAGLTEVLGNGNVKVTFEQQ